MSQELNIKSFIIDPAALDAAAADPQPLKKKVCNKKYTVEYSNDSDIVIRRNTESKNETQRLNMLPSKNEFFISVEKTGEKKEVTESTLSGFFCGLEDTETQYRTGNVAFPYFCRQRPWCRAVVGMLHNDTLMLLVTSHVTNASTIGDLTANDYWLRNMSRNNMTLFYENSRASTSVTVPSKLDVLAKNHDFVAWMLAKYGEANYLSPDYCVFESNLDKMSMDTVRSFILISKVYGVDFAKELFQKWASDSRYSVIPSARYFVELLALQYITTDLSRDTGCRYMESKKLKGLRSACLPANEKFLPTVDYFAETLFDGVTVPQYIPADSFSHYLLDESLKCGYANNLEQWVKMWIVVLSHQYWKNGAVSDSTPACLTQTYVALTARASFAREIASARTGYSWREMAEAGKKYESTAGDWSLSFADNAYDYYDVLMNLNNAVTKHMGIMPHAGFQILFLRSKKSEDTYAVELRDGKVFLVAGKNDSAPSEEILAVAESIVSRSSSKLTA